MLFGPEGIRRQQEQNLFFSTERILRWMRWIHGNKNLHPELEAYELGVQKEGDHRLVRHRYARKAYHASRL